MMPDSWEALKTVKRQLICTDIVNVNERVRAANANGTTREKIKDLIEEA